MKSRVRPPSLVSMWMLDVFCCALGCVTLLWLLNTRQAKMVASDLATEKTHLAQSRADLDQSRTQLSTATRQETILMARISQLETERDRLSTAMVESQAVVQTLAALLENSEKREAGLAKNIDDLKTEQKRLTGMLADAKAELATRTRSRDTLQNQLDAAKAEMAVAQAKLDASQKEYAKAMERVATLTTKVATLEEVSSGLKKESSAMNQSAKDRAEESERMAKQIAAMEKKLLASTQSLEDAKRNVIDLQGEKKAVEIELSKRKSEEESRFAGIVMSGKNVVFLIDVSGSMERLDTNTPDPKKWPIVIETLTKVMRSLAQLEKFQIILFSDRVQFPFGQRGRWMLFEGEPTIAIVKQTLERIRPEGDTNLYDAFEAAFPMREEGMDSIYLFSDGLPTSGPGLTIAQQAQGTNLPDGERSDILARYIREKMRTSWNNFRATGPKRVRINSIGFFFENPAVGSFLWGLSRDNDGSFVGMSKP